MYMQSTEDAALATLRSLDARIEVVAAGIVQAWVPTAALDRFAALHIVRAITPPDYAVPQAGSVTTEGDALHRANLVREWSSLTGAGVNIGLIDYGLDSIAEVQATNDLPANIEVKPGSLGRGDHGTASLQVIHDMAPGANLAIAHTFTSLDYIQSVEWLQNDAFGGEGADVIVGVVHMYGEPYFEDGPAALSTADALESGAVFIVAAGNHALRHYEGTFVNAGDGFHAFDPNDDFLRFHRTGFGRSTHVILQWNDRHNASGTDYDLFLCGRDQRPTKFNIQNGMCVTSNAVQNGDDRPIEQASTSQRTVDMYIRQHTSGSGNYLELFVTTDGNFEKSGQPSGGIVGPAAVTGAIAVGAIGSRYSERDARESYSNYGDAEIFFPNRETRPKPDVVATTNVAVAVSVNSGLGFAGSTYGGTSGATPHVAGVAALLVEAERLASPTSTREEVADAVYEKIVETAVDLGEPGIDSEYGAGRVDALLAVASTGQLDSLTFTVGSTGDGADDDTTDSSCDDGNGECTLRAAIQQANADKGGIIKFAIAGDGPHVISPATALPSVAKTLSIEGFSQNGASRGTIKVKLDGTNAGDSANGITLAADGSSVRGLAIESFGGVGVSVAGVSATEISGNIVSGNGSHGISVVGTRTDRVLGTLVARNGIGADATGTMDVGNGGAGIYYEYAEEGSVLDNLISGNASHGISLHVARNWMARNRIGTTGDGDSALGNDGAGIHSSIKTGGANRIVENVIAFNGGDGVSRLHTGRDGHTVKRNSIHSNTGLGIDTGPDGVTSNDAEDANFLLNFPVLSSAAIDGEDFHVTGNLETDGYCCLVVDFYSSTSCDAEGYGEGQTWLGSTDFRPTAAGPLPFSVSTLRGDIDSPQVPMGNFITAVSTYDPTSSEFSACIEASTLPQLKRSAAVVTPTEGGTATYTLTLSAQPASDVTVSLSSVNTEVATVLPASLTFTTDNWAVARTVTVSGAEDDDIVDARTEILHTLTVAGNSFDGHSTPVEVTDVDRPSLMVWGQAHEVGTLYDYRVTLDEGESVTYEAVLAWQPEGDVTVAATVVGTRWITVEPPSVTFNSMNWDTPQTFTLTAKSVAATYDRSHSYTHTVEIGGKNYVVARIFVLTRDPKQVEITLTPPAISLNEGETSAYTVALQAQPSREVTIYLLSDDIDAATPWPQQLHFDDSNWDTPKTVTVTGALDADGRDEAVRVFHYDSPRSAINTDDLRFRGGVSVAVTDQDLPGLRLSAREGVDVVEGQDSTYTVELAEQPSSDLTVTLTSSNPQSLTVLPASQTFGPTTWDVPQTVTLTGVWDANDSDELVEVRHGTAIASKSYILLTSTAQVSDRSNTSLSPPATDPVAPRSAAVYTIRFRSRWDFARTPPEIPAGAHFSRLIGAVHSADVSFLEAGATASPGVEAMAETGATSVLRGEINAAQGSVLSVLQGTSSSFGPIEALNLSATLSSVHPRVTLLSMIAPSPDWFVGVAGLPLLYADGNWKESLDLKLYPWDAGTEDGTEFSLSNSATSPQGVITNLRGVGKFSNKEIADLRFTLRSVNLLATGKPTIAGLPEVGEVLTADASGIDDADGVNSASYRYHWIRVAPGGAESEVAGPLTSPNYTVQAADIGSRLKVRVTLRDNRGNEEELTSALTSEATVVQVSVSFGSIAYVAVEGGPPATVQVLLDKDARRTVAVPLWATLSGGASTADYAVPERIVFNPGETSKDAAVLAVDDRVDDDGESIELRFGALPDGVSTVHPLMTVVGMEDNDHVPVTLGWDGTTHTAEEPTSPGSTGTVTLTAVAYTAKDKRPDVGFSFDYRVATSNGSAQSPSDFGAISVTATFARNEFSRTFVNGHYRYEATRTYSVSIEHDTVDEPNETFQINLSFVNSGLPYLRQGDMTATVTVTDDIASLADLQTSVLASDGSVSRSEDLTYSWTANNIGPAAATGTTLTASLDVGTSFVSATPDRSCSASGNTVTCSLGTLEVGNGENGSITVQVRNNAAADLDFSLSFRSDQLDRTPGNNTATQHTELEAPPEAMTNLRVSSSNTFVDLTWSAPRDNGSPITSYILERKSDTGDFVPLTPEPAGGTTSYRDNSVEVDVNYSYRIKAVNEDGDGGWSNEAHAKLSVASAPPPVSSGGGGGGGGGGGFGPAPVAPKFGDGFRTARSLAQNARPGDPVGDPVAATHPDDLAITYSLSGTDAASFAVDGETGQLRVTEGVALEAGRTYTVNLTATDSAGFGAIIIVVIEVVEATHHVYDANRNGVIDRDEVIAAVKDYFNGETTKEEVIELIKLYFAGPG